jgi:hypothetical protein
VRVTNIVRTLSSRQREEISNPANSARVTSRIYTRISLSVALVKNKCKKERLRPKLLPNCFSISVCIIHRVNVNRQRGEHQ